MIYKQLGKTGLKVSRLGFGAMRLPMVGEGEAAKVDLELAVPMIHRAFEAGVNYIDTATMYCNNDGQNAVGAALKGWRDKIIVSTKNPYYDEDEKIWWGNLENSLKCLQVDCIDIYNVHGINWKAWQEKIEPRVSKWIAKAQDQKLIRHICFSFHDNNEGLMKMVDTGFGAVVTLQYNMFDRSLEEGIAHAHAKGMGVIVMGPVGGGVLGEDSDVLAGLLPEVRRVPELALRFVLGNPNVTVALSGMSTIQQVEENVATASDPVSLSEADYDLIRGQLERFKGMADLYCTGCAYCKPCPAGIDIPKIFRMYNRGRVYGFWDMAKRVYAGMPTAQWGKSELATACTECGQCEEKCPQHLPIRAQLKEAHAALVKP